MTKANRRKRSERFEHLHCYVPQWVKKIIEIKAEEHQLSVSRYLLPFLEGIANETFQLILNPQSQKEEHHGKKSA